MKKLLLVSLICVIGCTNLGNTPIKKTEEFFKKYQVLDSVVLEDLEEVVSADNSMTEEQKDEYKNIMKKQYQNLTYSIKEESLDGDQAVVTVDIEVVDFNKVLDEATLYLSQNSNFFENESGDFDNNKFITYKLEKMKDAKEKVKYTIYIPLVLVNEEWKIDLLDETIYEKINGNYDY